MSLRADLHVAHIPDEGRATSTSRAVPGRPPLVLVEWQDAWFEGERESIEDAPEDYLVRTVGFLVRMGGRVLSVAQELLPDGDGFRAVTHIPAGMVERIVPLDAVAETVGGA
jgi:hypothetical protein